LASSIATISLRALMKCVPLSLVCALAFFCVACEQQPLRDEPAIPDEYPVHDRARHPTGEQHLEGKATAAGEGRDANAQPAAKSGETGAVKPAEPPKFFPETSK
jgi:hypothetical protein